MLTDLTRDNLDAKDGGDGFHGQTWLNINALTNLNVYRCEPIQRSDNELAITRKGFPSGWCVCTSTLRGSRRECPTVSSKLNFNVVSTSG